MSVTAAAGFRAAGATAGLKPSGRSDLAVVINDGPTAHAAVLYTSNRCTAHPVDVSKAHSADGTVRGVILNSGGANCFTGAYGRETAELTAAAFAEGIGCPAEDIVVCSTGLIGVGGEDFRSKILTTVPAVVSAASPTGGHAAAEAIMTTDTVPKEAERAGAGYTIGGMAKGAGMLAPALATMLVVITTDAALDAQALDRALRRAAALSFDRLDSDGCMSTNDTVALLSSGLGAQADEEEFTQLLTELCCDLARQLLADAEGAEHNIEIIVRGAASEADAVEVGRAVSRSNLFKAAVFGEDPNWGRVVAQIGTTQAAFDPAAIDVTFNGVEVCRASGPHADPAEVVFGRDVCVEIDLHSGNAEATVLTNDLTHAYVEENSAYSS